MTDFQARLTAQAYLHALQKPTVAELSAAALGPEIRAAQQDRIRDFTPPRYAPVILTKHERAQYMRQWEKWLTEYPCLVAPNMAEIMNSPGELDEEDTAYLKAKGWME